MLYRDTLKSIPILISVLCLSFSVFFFAKETIPKFSRPMITSEDGYARLASGIAHTSVATQARDYIWPPLTKIFYSIPVIYYPQNQYISARILAWLLIVGTTILTGLITYHFTQSRSFAIMAFSLALTNPVNILLSSQTLSENIWLFTLGLSLWFLSSPHQKNWKWGYVFWSLSQSCRYESWYLTPVALVFFWFLHHHIRATKMFFMSSLVFPVYWLMMTVVDTSNIHYYLDEKLTQAAHGPPEIYHNLLASFKVWYKQLNNTFTPLFTQIFLLGIYYFIRKKNFLFVFPVFIFSSLVFQVYIATMEFFPIRYLAILPLTAIPPTVIFIHSWKVNKLIKLLFVVLILLVGLQTVRHKIAENTDYIAQELIEVGPVVGQSKSPCITYVKDASTYMNDYSAFWYFSQKPVYAINHMKISNPLNYDYNLRADCFTVVVEKRTRTPILVDNLTEALGKPIFENKMFRIYEPPAMKSYAKSQN